MLESPWKRRLFCYMQTLKDMENYLSAKHYGTLECIKKQCRKRVYSRTDIEEIGKTEHGTKYRSTQMFEYVLDEDLYNKQVAEYFRKVFKPEKKKREIGKNINQREAFEIIFRDLFTMRNNEKNRVFLANVDPETQTIVGRKKSVADMNGLLKNLRAYSYFTNAFFYSHRDYTKENLRQLHAITLDFDLDKHSVFMCKSDLYKYIKDNIGVAPNLIWDTKTPGNYQAVILLETMAGTSRSVHLFEQIVKEMCYKMPFADSSIVSANHLFSIPKSNKDRKIRKYHTTVKNIDDFRWLLSERDERRSKQATNGNVLEFTNVAVRKHPAITALFDAEIKAGQRNVGCLTLSLVMRFLGYSELECENYIVLEWYPKIHNRACDGSPFTRNEMYQCIKKAYSDRYKCFHSFYVEQSTGIDCDIKGYFRNAVRNQEIYSTGNKKKVIAFLEEQNGKFKGQMEDIATFIGANKRTLERTMRELRKEGIINYETSQGRSKQSVFTLRELQQEVVFTVDGDRNIISELAHLEQIEAIVSEINVS